MTEVSTVLALLARLEQRVLVLEERPDRPPGTDPPATDSAASSSPAPRAWWWPHLNATDAVAAWGHLGAWVRDSLLARQPTFRRVLRPCWRQHPDVVDELTALRLLWLDAYPNPQPGPSAAKDYLAHLPVVLARVEAAFKNAGCKTVAGAYVHADNDEPFGLVQWDGEAAATFIEADSGGRAAPE